MTPIKKSILILLLSFSMPAEISLAANLFLSNYNHAEELYNGISKKFLNDHYEIFVNFKPQENSISYNVEINFKTGDFDGLIFWLNKNLNIHSLTKEVEINVLKSENPEKVLYKLDFKGSKRKQVKFNIFGKIFDDWKDGESHGFISEEGIVLLPSSNWLPIFENRLFSFDLKVMAPMNDWEVISQGELHKDNFTNKELFNESPIFNWKGENQEELYLIAGPFYKSVLRNEEGLEAVTYFKNQDAELSNKYLKATLDYIHLYSNKIGTYPYRKFALVENYWETGFGMPSFTLLGPTVIRLPFIIYSSYPHEILHNWWGNGVYVDFDSGNWSEGLTTYMADHYFQELRGQDLQYRRTTLQNYKSFVSTNNDFALKDFKGRHNASSQAIGYGKTMMLFHMLKVKFGEVTFDKVVQSFYKKYLFKRASFQSWREVFEQETNLDLNPYFQQWVNRVGAPELKIVNIKKENGLLEKDVYVTIELEQIHEGDPYELDVPIEFVNSSGDKVLGQMLKMNQKFQKWMIKIDNTTTKVKIDPNFDIFRRLDVEELPPSFTEIFGISKKTYFVIPKIIKGQISQAEYKFWAESLYSSLDGEVIIINDDQLFEWPENSTVWILGYENKLVEKINGLGSKFNFNLSNNLLAYKDQVLNLSQLSTSLVVRSLSTKIAFLSATNSSDLQRLGNRLPRYGSSSFVVFESDKIILNQTWPVIHSPLVREIK